MEFKKLSLDCIQTIKPFFTDNRNRICDCTTGGTFMWRDYHNTEYAISDGALYFKVDYPGSGTAFTPPRHAGEGASVDRSSYEPIFGYCDKNGVPARICAVSETVMNSILELFPHSEAHTDRAWSDYLYRSGDIIDLPGRKFSGQRNHINRFLREHPNWSFETFSDGNRAAIRAFFDEYARNNSKDYPAYDEGNRKTLEVLDNFELYGMCCGALFIDGKVVGASLGEIVGDTLFVHAEKAETSYHGAYPMLVNQFARRFAVDGIDFINREEDDGVDGLRSSKLSYHPAALLDKYIIELRM